MGTFYILVLMFITPAHELEVVVDDDMFETQALCQARAVQRLDEADGHVLWIAASCAEVPKNPTAGKQT
jgi:hypothetical protein